MIGNDQCPICLSPAERGRDRDYGHKKQVRCPRCGLYEISGMALAMLKSRINKDPLARARLSHAIRLNTSEVSAFFISSANLDELIQRPLPGDPQRSPLLDREGLFHRLVGRVRRLERTNTFRACSLKFLRQSHVRAYQDCTRS